MNTLNCTVFCIVSALLAAPASAEWSWTTSGPDTRYGVLAMAVDPVNPDLQYAGDDEGGLYKSVDGGASWKTIWEPRQDNSFPYDIHGIAVDPYSSDVYVDSGGTVYKSPDAGSTWITLESLWGWVIPSILEPGVLYGRSSESLMMSYDHGASWSEVSPGLFSEEPRAASITVSPHNPNLLLATTRGAGFAGDDPDTWPAGVQLLRSLDGGAIWSDISSGLRSETIRVITLAMSPADPNIVYAGGWDGANGGRTAIILKSSDGAQSWSEVFALEDRQFKTLAADPYDPDVVYAGSIGKVGRPGLFTSRDGGQTWTKIHPGGPATILVDPRDSNILHVAMRENASGVYRFTYSGSTGTSVQAAGWGAVKAASQQR